MVEHFARSRQTALSGWENLRKSHDVWGKKFFHNLPLSVDDTFHVAMVTPVVHYCMGGLKINDDAEVLGAEDKVISGLSVCSVAVCCCSLCVFCYFLYEKDVCCLERGGVRVYC